MKEADYLSIYLLVVVPLALTASYFLEIDKGQALRWNISLWSLTVLGGTALGHWLAKKDNKRDINQLMSQDNINKIVTQVLENKKHNS